jgi:long-chain acyl-CoA synthetase
MILENHQGFVKHIIVIGELSDDLKLKIEKEKVSFHMFSEIIELGKKNPSKHIPPKPDDVATISFTSGTTGPPKGAMLSHGSIISASITPMVHLVYGKEVHLSYLPLAHVMERIIHTVLFHYAASIGFFQGDPLKLLEDVKELKPTVFVAVPRIFNRIHGFVKSEIEKKGGLTKTLFDYAFASKLELLSEGQPCHHWLYDKFIFKKIRESLGGRVKIIITGSAPLSKDVMNFLRVCFSASVLEAYGQTETSGLGTFTLPEESEVGHVGPPTLCNEIVLEDVPDMNYFHTDTNPRGEILIRSYYQFKGYYKEPKKTEETITKDGWVHTGDIGMWLPNGTLKIIDRKKNIFKLSQGEYIAPEKIENIMVQCNYVQAVWITGNSLQNFIVGVICPNVEELIKYSKSINKSENIEEICKDVEVNGFLLKELEKIGTLKGLNKLEIPKKIHLEPKVWDMDCGLLTPTMKTKRNEMEKHYKSVIDALYQ